MGSGPHIHLLRSLRFAALDDAARAGLTPEHFPPLVATTLGESEWAADAAEGSPSPSSSLLLLFSRGFDNEYAFRSTNFARTERRIVRSGRAKRKRRTGDTWEELKLRLRGTVAAGASCLPYSILSNSVALLAVASVASSSSKKPARGRQLLEEGFRWRFSASLLLLGKASFDGASRRLRCLISDGAAYRSDCTIRQASHSRALTYSQGQEENMLPVTSRDHGGSGKGCSEREGDSPGE